MQMEKNLNSPARVRLAALFDNGAYQELGAYVLEKDSPAGVVSAYGEVQGNPVYAFAQDQSVENGAVGVAQAEKIATVYELATKVGVPVVGIYDSNGAFMDGTADSLNAFSKMLSKASMVSGVVPQIAVVAGACAGSAAMLASTADFVIACESSAFYLTPGTVADGVATASANGTVALTAKDDTEAIADARKLLALLPLNNMGNVPCMEYTAPKLAAAGSTLTSLVDAIADGDSAIELFADFGTSTYTALATINGMTTAIAATNKTDNKLTAVDCAKLARFMKLCDAYSIPVITIIDTPGFDGTESAELSGAVKSLAMLAGSYAEATTAKITLVTGKAVGPVFVALGGKYSGADMTFAFKDAYIAPLAPESAVEFLMHDKLKGAKDLTAKRAELAKEYTTTTASALSAAQRGTVDDVIAPETLRPILTQALSMLEGKRVTTLPRKHSNFPL